MAMHRIDDTLPPELAADDPADEVWASTIGEVASSHNLRADEVVRVVTGEPVPDVALTPQDQADIEPAKRWTIQNDRAAEWAMRHVAEAEAELAGLAEQRDAWMARIAAWYEHRERAAAARRAFFVHHLEHYALARRREDPRVKSLDLPSGRVQTRQEPAKVTIVDQTEAVHTAKLWAPDAVKIQESVLVSKLREVIKPAVAIDVELICNHWTQIVCPVDGPYPGEGEVAYCAECDARRAVFHVEDDHLVPVNEQGDALEGGLSVEPSKITASVKVS